MNSKELLERTKEMISSKEPKEDILKMIENYTKAEFDFGWDYGNEQGYDYDEDKEEE